MNKFLRLCKKPFLITSIILFVGSLVAFVILSCYNYSREYAFKDSFLGATANVDIYLNDDKHAVVYVNVEGFGSDYDYSSREVFEYKVLNNNLYFYKNTDEGEQVILFGQINAYEVIPNQMSLKKCNVFIPNIILKNNLMINIKITSIVFMFVFGFIFVECLIILILDRTYHLKKESKVTA